MTYEQMDKAKELLCEIDEAERECVRFGAIRNRIKETTAPYQEHIRIQLSEGYMGTPNVKVNIKDLLDFLSSQADIIADRVEQLKKEFVEL